LNGKQEVVQLAWFVMRRSPGVTKVLHRPTPNARRPKYNDATKNTNPRKDNPKRIIGELIVVKSLALPRRPDQNS
jgi:hypothetical protein